MWAFGSLKLMVFLLASIALAAYWNFPPVILAEEKMVHWPPLDGRRMYCIRHFVDSLLKVKVS